MFSYLNDIDKDSFLGWSVAELEVALREAGFQVWQLENIVNDSKALSLMTVKVPHLSSKLPKKFRAEVVDIIIATLLGYSKETKEGEGAFNIVTTFTAPKEKINDRSKFVYLGNHFYYGYYGDQYTYKGKVFHLDHMTTNQAFDYCLNKGWLAF